MRLANRTFRAHCGTVACAAAAWAASAAAISAQDRMTMTCSPTVGGVWTSEIELDIANGTLGWGTDSYVITYADEDHLLAVLAGYGPNGVVFFLERKTGSFWRAAAGRFCWDETCAREDSVAITEQGLCR